MIETFFTFADGVTVWHWLILALVLLGIEMALGTYDLLWVAGAAALTALYAAIPLPDALGSWQAELAVFSVSAIVLVVLGRTAFSSMRSPGTKSHPNLNQRDKALVGRMGQAASDFVGAQGRVKIGDTEWMAESVDGPISEGVNIIVESVDGTLLKVRMTG